MSIRRLRPHLRRLAPSVALLALLGLALLDPVDASGPSSQLSPAAPAPQPALEKDALDELALEVVATGLGSVTAITHAGDDRLFVTIRDGRIVIVEGGQVRAQPFLDIRGQVALQGEQGLLSTAFHPRYGENGFFFVNYTRSGDGATVIARYRVSGDPDRADPASARTLLVIAQPFSNHNGGQLQFGPDGFLYIGMGDGGSANDPQCLAQRDTTLLGKMLRIDVDQNVQTAPFHGIPVSNPFRGPGGPPDEVWAEGLRNPWRFSFDRATGELYIADVGQNAREEVSLQPAGSRGGENYGWKVMEGTACFSTSQCPAGTPPCNSPALTLPIIEYDHAAGCSISGGYVYRGSRIPALQGFYLFGDFCAGFVRAARREGGRFAVRELPLRVERLVTFGEDVAGEIYVGNLDGGLWRITGPGGTEPEPEARPDHVGLFDPATARFLVKRSHGNGQADLTVRFGPQRSGWTPLTGDWDGDGDDGIGYHDPRAGRFRLKNALAGGAADALFALGPRRSDWVPLAGDWDGDGDDTVGFFDPATATFNLTNRLGTGGLDLSFQFGTPGAGWTPLAGDWDGDGVDTVGFYDRSRSLFLLKNSLTGGAPDVQFVFGSPGPWLPIAGDWDGDGRDTVGLFNRNNSVFRLRNAQAGGAADLRFQLSPRGGGVLPIVGDW